MRRPLKLGVTADAMYGGPNKEYRYLLRRDWDDRLPRCCWVLLNPSTATEFDDDPTLEAVQVFARLWGYGSLTVVNLFAFRSPSPMALTRCKVDPIGGEMNDVMILAAVQEAELTIAAWGNHGKILNRSAAVRDLLAGFKLHCLAVSKQAEPVHPLYQKRTTQLMELTA